ncbi:MAG: hypothetical protein RMM17_02930 [Acidobacteriota bacterium]|nr:hypothetical protein [Blastocatellia bacterium]MDW8411622.1 hypothetical protein [Acidobacteriota bacterium]
MVDITNFSFFGSVDSEALAEEAKNLQEALQSAGAAIAVPTSPQRPSVVDSDAVLGKQETPQESEGVLSETQKATQGSEPQTKSPEARFLRPQRGFEATAMREQLSKLLTQQRPQTGSAEPRVRQQADVEPQSFSRLGLQQQRIQLQQPSKFERAPKETPDKGLASQQRLQASGAEPQTHQQTNVGLQTFSQPSLQQQGQVQTLDLQQQGRAERALKETPDKGLLMSQQLGSRNASGLVEKGRLTPIDSDEKPRGQATFSGDKAQIRAALQHMFPQFSLLPAQSQSLIVDVYLSLPRLPLEAGIVLINFVETAQLGAADKQLFLKLLGNLILSPRYADPLDTRLKELVEQLARGVLELRVTREGPSRAEPATIVLNLNDAQLQMAINLALQGDTQPLVTMLLAFSRSVSESQAQDVLWQSLESIPDFRTLGEVKTQVYRAVKAFPETDVGKVVEYAALPSKSFLKALPSDRAAELRLLASLTLEAKKQSSATSFASSDDKAGSVPTSSSTEAALAATVIERIASGNIPLKIYKAADGRKVSSEGKQVALNVADPSVKRSLEGDCKLAASAVARFAPSAMKYVDVRAEKLQSRPSFRRLDAQTSRTITSILDDYPDVDPDLLAKFAESQDFCRGDSSRREKAHAIRFIASVLHQVSSDPKRMDMAYQAILRLINGDIQFTGFMREAAGLVADGSGIAIDPKYLDSEQENAVQIVAEVTQALQERPSTPWGGTIAMFATDYRAAYAEEFFRTNAKPCVSYMKQVLDMLVSSRPSSTYAQLRHTYATDPDFARIVDYIRSELDEERVVEPEELRQMLLEIIGKSPNITSSEMYEQPWLLDVASPFPDATAVVAAVAAKPELSRLNADEQAVIVNMVRKYGCNVDDFCRFVSVRPFLEHEEKKLLLRVFGTLSALMKEYSLAADIISGLLSGRTKVEVVQQSELLFDGKVLRFGREQTAAVDDWMFVLAEEIRNAS